MILYCAISYLIMLGMMIEEESEDKLPWWPLILAPLLVPIFIGMEIANKNK